MEPPKSGLADKAIAMAKAVVGDLVPFGGSLSELASWFIRTPFERRTEEWQAQVGEALHSLASERGVRLEDLQNDPKFVDTVLHATQVALRNANEEKREALRNAIVNSALASAPDESQRQMFLNYIDTFTPWHLRVLALFNNPPEWFRRHDRQLPSFSFTSSLEQVLESAFPDLRGRRDFYDQVWADLNNRGMLSTPSLHAMMSPAGAFAERATPLGRSFIAFITEQPAATSR